MNSELLAKRLKTERKLQQAIDSGKTLPSSELGSVQDRVKSLAKTLGKNPKVEVSKLIQLFDQRSRVAS